MPLELKPCLPSVAIIVEIMLQLKFKSLLSNHWLDIAHYDCCQWTNHSMELNSSHITVNLSGGAISSVNINGGGVLVSGYFDVRVDISGAGTVQKLMLL